MTSIEGSYILFEAYDIRLSRFGVSELGQHMVFIGSAHGSAITGLMTMGNPLSDTHVMESCSR